MSFRFLLPLFLVLMTLEAIGQNSKLADQYYLEGEYQKAGDLYLKLHETAKKNNNFIYFNKYIECLLAMQAYDQAEKEIKDQMKAQPDDFSMLVTLGNVQERIGNYEEAQASYKLAIEKLPAKMDAITRLGNAFLSQAKYDEAIETYEKGEKLLEKPGIFSYQLADLYKRNGDIAKMIEQYLYSLQSSPDRLESIQNMLQRSLKPADYQELLSQLYVFIQDYPETDYFPEMLAWTFMQQKDYSKAMRQAKALDKRMGENGLRVYRLAQIAANDKDYVTAIDGFEYILTTQSPGSPYFLEAKRASLQTKRRQITDNYSYTTEQLRGLETEYQACLDAYGIHAGTAQIVSEYAMLEALYINDLPKAISLLEQVVNLPGINNYVQAYSKLDLGDYYLMSGEVWESTLLYSQVDKAFVEDLIGQDARFRNARLSYYNGDFEWAQAQFDILKTSTSKLISNDALDMSIFIMDNLGLDSNTHALSEYAQAELLIFQNKLDEAIEKLNILGNIYSEHGLKDDILYLEARLYEKKRDYLKAETLYQEIIEKFPEEIRADNALYNQAQLYEHQLNDKEKAKACYEKLFLEYTDSTFSIDARKRYRELRGDFEEEQGQVQ
ncbi:MAG: tetratricopeptide repeat protein [Saprospiraceae bacterium]|nr:tetratricopeptide repeat protein [Candidatus Opimibacter iunctus]